MPISLEDGHRIERRDEGWVIVDVSAGCLFELERCMWSSDEPLVFDTPVAHSQPSCEPGSTKRAGKDGTGRQ